MISWAQLQTNWKLQLSRREMFVPIVRVITSECYNSVWQKLVGRIWTAIIDITDWDNYPIWEGDDS